MHRRQNKTSNRYCSSSEPETASCAVTQRRDRDLVEGISHGIVWEADASLRFCMISKRAEQMLGYSVEQWCGERDFWINHVYPEDRDRVLSAFRQALEGEDQACDHRFIAADGRVVWLHTGVHACSEGERTVYRGLSVEITYLKEIENALKQKTQEAEEASRSKSHFLSIASHEIRSALNAIIGYAYLLKDAQIREEKRIETYQHILRNAHDLLDLANRILDVEKIETGRMHLQAQIGEVSLSEMLRQILEDVKFLSEEKGLAVGLNDDPTAPSIRSDPGKLRQIFTNLIVNAIKFTEEGSISVRVMHHPRERTVLLEIEDTGMGISEQDLPHIFKPFYQTGGAAAPLGAGLGLSIVKNLVDFLKGNIDVKSRPGVGSTFVVTLPYDAS